jgi:signal recognition particle subunit SRP54
MFDSLTSKLGNALDSLRSRGKISSADIESTCAEIHQSLLEADVALSVVNEFIELIRTRSL